MPLRLALPWALLAAFGTAAAAGAAGPMPSPDAHPYVAQPGDTLIGIGRRYLRDPAAWPEVQRLNGIGNPRRMPVGRTLLLPLHLLRTESAPATLQAVSGSVRSGGAPVAAGQAVAEGADLSTGDDGHVTVRLVDGTVLRLRSGARLRIEESRRVSVGGSTRSGVRLDQGRVEVDAAPTRGGQPGFRIGTPQGVMGVRGTAFRVEADAGSSRGEVLEGVVGVSSPASAEQRVAAGFGTVVDGDGRVAAPVPLLSAPDLAGLPARHERPLVRLRLPAPAQAQGWRVQVALDDRFEALLADLRSGLDEVRIAGLPDGRYALRVRAVGALGLEGRDSTGVLVLKARPEPPLPRAPAPGAVIVGSALSFAWTASVEAARYRLQVARAGAAADPFSAPLHDRAGLAATESAVDGLAPGAYVWRLASVRADGDSGPFGDAIAFEVKAPPPQPAPPGPPGPPTVGDHGVRVFWQGQAGQRFDFEVARDPAFTQPVLQRLLDVPEIDLPLPGDGRFFVRLRVREADGFIGPWSAAQHFDVVPCVRDGSNACVRVGAGTLQRP